LLEKYDSAEIINVGCGEDISIRELAELICDVVGFGGELAWDKTKPDGTLRKLLDVSKLSALGWSPTIPLRDGIARTYDWFLKNVANEKTARPWRWPWAFWEPSWRGGFGNSGCGLYRDPRIRSCS